MAQRPSGTGVLEDADVVDDVVDVSGVGQAPALPATAKPATTITPGRASGAPKVERRRLNMRL
jgi:hypothetical protein